jgi:hypothetical protein
MHEKDKADAANTTSMSHRDGRSESISACSGKNIDAESPAHGHRYGAGIAALAQYATALSCDALKILDRWKPVVGSSNRPRSFSHAPCLWYRRAFKSRTTGGSAGKFWGTEHRQQFWIAARRRTCGRSRWAYCRSTALRRLTQACTLLEGHFDSRDTLYVNPSPIGRGGATTAPHLDRPRRYSPDAGC